MDEWAAQILIADDQPENLLILESVLAGPYRVHAVADGHAALEVMESGAAIDLVLLDTVMPGLDGFEVCRRLKANPATAELPVLFLVALDGDGDGEEAFGLALGAEDFIHKPFSPPVVLARVRTHLRLWRQHQERETRKRGAQEAALAALRSLSETLAERGLSSDPEIAGALAALADALCAIARRHADGEA